MNQPRTTAPAHQRCRPVRFVPGFRMQHLVPQVIVVLMLIIVASAPVLLTGCSSRAGLARHINELLMRADAGGKDLSVAMDPRSRMGLAQFPAAEGEIVRLVSVLHLQEVPDALPSAGDPVAGWLRNAQKSYTNEMLRLPAGVRLFHSEIRQSSLKLRDDSQFEYLVLIYDPRSKRALILAEYAYG